jgi:hypothetical protein
MVINVQLIANALGIAAWGFGVPLVAPADRDFLAIKLSRDIGSGAVILALLAIRDHRAVAQTMLALTQSSSLQARGPGVQTCHSDSNHSVNLLYRPGSSAWSMTATPTYHALQRGWVDLHS